MASRHAALAVTVWLAVLHGVCASQSFHLAGGDGQAFRLDMAAADLHAIGPLAEGRHLLTSSPAVNAVANTSCQWQCGECSGVDDSLHTQLANATCTERVGDLAICGTAIVSGSLRRAVQAGLCHQVCSQARQETRCGRRLGHGTRAARSPAPGEPVATELLKPLLYFLVACLQLCSPVRAHASLCCGAAGAPQAEGGPATAPAGSPGPALDASASSASPDAPAAAPEGSPGCPPTSGCARTEWMCGRAQQWRLTPAQHRAAAAAEVCGADLDASFCFVGQCAAPVAHPVPASRAQGVLLCCLRYSRAWAVQVPHTALCSSETGLHFGCRC